MSGSPPRSRTASLLEEIHDNLICNAHDGIAAHLVVSDQIHRLIGKLRKCTDLADVFTAPFDEQVDVLGGTNEPVEGDREAADQDVAGTFLGEGAADREEVFEARRA